MIEQTREQAIAPLGPDWTVADLGRWLVEFDRWMEKPREREVGKGAAAGGER